MKTLYKFVTKKQFVNWKIHDTTEINTSTSFTCILNGIVVRVKIEKKKKKTKTKKKESKEIRRMLMNSSEERFQRGIRHLRRYNILLFYVTINKKKIKSEGRYSYVQRNRTFTWWGRRERGGTGEFYRWNFKLNFVYGMVIRACIRVYAYLQVYATCMYINMCMCVCIYVYATLHRRATTRVSISCIYISDLWTGLRY